MMWITLVVGILAGLGAIGYLLLLWAANQNPLGRYSFMSLPVHGIFFCVALLIFRDKFNAHRLKLIDAFKLGFFLNIFATLIFYLGMSFLFSHTEMGTEIMAFHKGELLQILDTSREMDAERMTEEVYKETKANIHGLEAATEVSSKALFFHLSGLFLTLIMGLIFRHDPK